MNVTEVAKELDMSEANVHLHLKQNKFPGATKATEPGSRGRWDIPESAVTAFKLTRGTRKRRKKPVKVEPTAVTKNGGPSAEGLRRVVDQWLDVLVEEGRVESLGQLTRDDIHDLVTQLRKVKK